MTGGPRGAAYVVRAIGPEAGARLRDAARVIGWGLLLYGAILLVASKLQSRAFGALALQMVLAEWGAGRLAVAWSDPSADPPSAGAIARRASRGAALGAAVALGVVGFALATRAVTAHANSPEPAQLGMGLVTAALAAARDELVLRGVVLRAFRRTASTLPLVLICGAAGAASEYGLTAAGGDVNGGRVLVAGLLGVTFAALWLVDRGGWLPLGAHAAWALGTGTMIHGGAFDLRPVTSSWGGGDAGILGGLATVLTLVPVAGLAVAWARRRSAPQR